MLLLTTDEPTVRPHELVRDVFRRHGGTRVHVTTPAGRYLGSVDLTPRASAGS